MSNRVVKVHLSRDGITQAQKALMEYWKDVQDKTHTFVKRLADIGAKSAEVNFSNAIYAGENDVKVDVERRGKDTVAVVATGNATIFIEFGTGVKYADDHPEPHGFKHGTYGKGLGGKLGKDGEPVPWVYRGEPGNASMPVHQKIGKGKDAQVTVVPGLYRTYGNPANRCMFDSIQDLKARISDIAQEVFR